MRAFSTAGQAAIAARTVSAFLLLDMATTPPVRMNSTPFTINVGGVDYFGAGGWGSLGQVEDTMGDFPGLRVALTGVPSEFIALALADAPATRGARAVISLALLDQASKAVTDVLQLFSGEVDQLPLSDGDDGATISANLVHRGATFSRPKPLRNTDNDQRRLYPDDTSRRHVVPQSQEQLVWPTAAFLRK